MSNDSADNQNSAADVNYHLTRLWVNRPIIEHGLLLYREARVNEKASPAAVDEVRKEFAATMKFICETLTFPDY